MNNIAVDTNILIYLYDADNVHKRSISENLLSQQPLISSQVVSEFINVSRRLLDLPKQIVFAKCLQVFECCIIKPTEIETLKIANNIMIKYDLQIFDAIIIAAALQNGCTILYSEDWQHNASIENQLTIINPFK